MSRVDPYPSVSGEQDAVDATDEDGVDNLVDGDKWDDGVVIFPPFRPGKASVVRVTAECSVNDTGVGPNGRYQANDPQKRIYVNGWVDWNGDGAWATPGEKILGTFSPVGEVTFDPETFGPNNRHTIGEPFVDANGSGKWEPGETYTESVGQTSQTKDFIVVAPAAISPYFYSRFRLDYGEDVGVAGNASGDLIQDAGQAAFGEVEDYAHDGLQPYYPPVDADQLHVAVPAAGAVDIGAVVQLDAWVERGFQGVPNAGVIFKKLAGNFVFLEGAIDAPAGETATLTDDNGFAQMFILTGGGGLVVIEVSVPGAANLSPAYVILAVAGPCVPDCLNKQCGDDGCGGSCGDCPQGVTCTENGQCQQTFGDIDGDADVDLADFAAFQACYSGERTLRSAECAPLDANSDAAVDETDLAEFEVNLTGPR